MALVQKVPVYRLKRRWREAMRVGKKRSVGVNSGGHEFTFSYREPDEIIAGNHWQALVGAGPDDLLERLTPPYRPVDQIKMLKRGWLVENGAPDLAPVPEPTPVPEPALEPELVSEPDESGISFPATPGPEPVISDEPSPEMAKALESVRTIAPEVAPTEEPDVAPAGSDESHDPEPPVASEEPLEASAEPTSDAPADEPEGPQSKLAALAALPRVRKRKK